MEVKGKSIPLIIESTMSCVTQIMNSPGLWGCQLLVTHDKRSQKPSSVRPRRDVKGKYVSFVMEEVSRVSCVTRTAMFTAGCKSTEKVTHDERSWNFNVIGGIHKRLHDSDPMWLHYSRSVTDETFSDRLFPKLFLVIR